VQLALEYRLPLLLPRDIQSYLSVLRLGDVDIEAYVDAFAVLEASGMPTFQRFTMTPGITPSAAAYRPVLVPSGPGLTFVSLHPNTAGDIEAITAGHPRQDPAWRVGEDALLLTGAADDMLQAEGIERRSMRTLRDVWRNAG